MKNTHQQTQTKSNTPSRSNGILNTALVAASALITLQGVGHSQNVLLNGSFELTPINQAPYNTDFDAITNPDGHIASFNGGTIRRYEETATNIGWLTTSINDDIELWSNASTLSGDIDTPHGVQWAEVNSTTNSSLYQDVAITTAGLVDLGFSHRARTTGSDTLSVIVTDLGGDNTFGGGDDDVVFTKTYTTGRAVWVDYTEADTFTSIANRNYRFEYQAVSTANDNILEGNFIDNAFFGVDAVPEPSTALLGVFGVSLLLRRRR